MKDALFTFCSLQKRQKEWADEEEYRRVNALDPNMPPGHKVLDDAERRDTLDKLKKSEY